MLSKTIRELYFYLEELILSFYLNVINLFNLNKDMKIHDCFKVLTLLGTQSQNLI